MSEFHVGDLVRLTKAGARLREGNVVHSKGIVVGKENESVKVLWQGQKVPWTENRDFLIVVEEAFKGASHG